MFMQLKFLALMACSAVRANADPAPLPDPEPLPAHGFPTGTRVNEIGPAFKPKTKLDMVFGERMANQTVKLGDPAVFQCVVRYNISTKRGDRGDRRVRWTHLGHVQWENGDFVPSPTAATSRFQYVFSQRENKRAFYMEIENVSQGATGPVECAFKFEKGPRDWAIQKAFLRIRP